MLKQRRFVFTPDFAACARAYALDLLSSAFLFVCTSLMAGRVWRFPFDDEVYTLGKIEDLSGLELIKFYLTAHDVHPPLGYLLYWVLNDIGLSEAGMRLVSLAMTALALVLYHLLTLWLLAGRQDGPIAPATRLIAVLLFGLCALAVSQGDALRWYPLFTLETAVFVVLYLAGGNGAARLWAGAVLGLAASTNFLAALVIGPLALYRYGLQRRFQMRCDAAFWLLFLLFSSAGICTALYLFLRHVGLVGAQIGNGVMQAALTHGLGFFGGHALGIGQAWIVVPAAVIAAIAAVSLIDRKAPAQPVHLLLLILVATVAMPLIGFAKPRSFLYLAPVLAAVLTLYLDRELRRRGAGIVLLLTAMLMATSVAAIANIKDSIHPFKRNTVIPYGTILDFIRANEQGRVLVLSTDPVVPWLLQQGGDARERCVVYFRAGGRCVGMGHYDTIFVIQGHSNRSADARVMRWVDDIVAGAIAGRQKYATLPAGLDRDAALKTRLTGVALGEAILTVDLYR